MTAQEGGPQDRADEERAWLNTEGVPDGHELDEAARYEASWGSVERAESLSEGSGG